MPRGARGIYETECFIPGNYFNNGVYFVGLVIAFLDNNRTLDCFYQKDALSFSIVDPIEETLFETRKGYSGSFPGPLRPQLDWKFTKLE